MMHSKYSVFINVFRWTNISALNASLQVDCSLLRVKLTEGIIDCFHLVWQRPSLAASLLSSHPLSALKPHSSITKGTEVPHWLSRHLLRQKWQQCHSSFFVLLFHLHYALNGPYLCYSNPLQWDPLLYDLKLCSFSPRLPAVFLSCCQHPVTHDFCVGVLSLQASFLYDFILHNQDFFWWAPRGVKKNKGVIKEDGLIVLMWKGIRFFTESIYHLSYKK